MKDLEQSNLAVYANEWWTRVIPVEGFLPNVHDKHPLGPDMALEMDYMFRIDPDLLPEFDPIFDPQKFQTQHQNISVSD